MVDNNLAQAVCYGRRTQGTFRMARHTSLLASVHDCPYHGLLLAELAESYVTYTRARLLVLTQSDGRSCYPCVVDPVHWRAQSLSPTRPESHRGNPHYPGVISTS